MKVGESQELLAQFEQDLAAERNPDIRTWYEQEFKLQQEFAIAQQAKTDIGTLVVRLGQLAEEKSQLAGHKQTEEGPENDPVEEPVAELPRTLTREEIVKKRIEKRFEGELKKYQEKFNSIQGVKKSKREHQERLMRRAFIRNFTDLSNITGDRHIILSSELLTWAADELFDDEILRKDLFLDCAEFAEHNGKEVTNSTKNFAHIISGYADGMPYAAEYGQIIKGLFSTRQNVSDIAYVYCSMADAVYELVDNFPALEKIADIVDTRNNRILIPRSFYIEKYKIDAKAAYNPNDERLADPIDLIDAEWTFQTMAYVLLGRELNVYNAHEDLPESMAVRILGSVMQELGIDINNTSSEELDAIADRNTLNISNYYQGFNDPVEITGLEGNTVELNGNNEAITQKLRASVQESDKFKKRMINLAPRLYAIEAAKKLLGGSGVSSLPTPLSPSITVEICLPFENSDGEDQTQISRQLINDHYGEVKDLVEARARKLQLNKAITPFEESGDVVYMKYEPFYSDNSNKGVMIYRPSIPSDKNYLSHPIFLLALNYSAVAESGHLEEDKTYIERNKRLRAEITMKQKRFLGRRPIKFSMPDTLRTTGLNSVMLRYDSDSATTKAKFELHDGSVEIELDSDFVIRDADMSASYFYENVILNVLNSWMCSNEIQTSEGTVSEESGNSANMGHFAYLRIRESDGRRYRFSEQQRDACKEEQCKDLATESERLKYLDPTGRQRNSTYVRENYDPSKPPLEIYHSADLLK